MESMVRTGNETVDRLSRLRITGNVIPQAWYKTIRKETGKPYLNAIVILSDFVYWYRAAEIRDEGSGDLIGYRKRFKADLLQRSYQQLADQFGITKRDATNAVIALEKLGVVTRVFRTLQIGGMATPNVLFLALDVEVLEKLTYPEKVHPEISEAENGELSSGEPEQSLGEGEKLTPLFYQENPSAGGCHRFGGDVPPERGRGIPQMRGRVPPESGTRPTETGETNTEITYKDYNTDYPILSYRQVKEQFKMQIEYPILAFDQERAKMGTEELDELIEVAVDVLMSNAKTLRVNREDKPAALVQEQYRRLTMFHIRYVLNSLQEMKTKAKNIRAVMMTALYNAVNTMNMSYENLYQHNQGIKAKIKEI